MMLTQKWTGSCQFLVGLVFGCGLTLLYNPSISTLYSTVSDKIYPPKGPVLPKNDTILLVWFWPFGKMFNLNTCRSKFNVTGCHLTADRELYTKADGVLLHHRDIAWDLSNLPKLPRPPFQKWVWMNFESPINTRKIPGLENLFNVTLNYRRDADIEMREKLVFRPSDAPDNPPIKEKTRFVCWIISNWNEQQDRVQYYKKLSQHINVDMFGRPFKKPINVETYRETMASCKFYLAFENTRNHVDYLTEKVYNALKFGSVPVVLGPPRHVYEKFLPGDAFIHVDDFPSAQEMAQHLLSLNHTQQSYLQFFRWRTHFNLKGVNFPEEHACTACQYIRKRPEYQVFTNLNQWYWN